MPRNRDNHIHDVLIKTLRNPLASDACCAITLAKGLGVLLTDNLNKPAPSDVIRAAMTFLTTDRSQDELKQIKRKQSICRCNMRIQAIRELHADCGGAIQADIFGLGFTSVCLATSRSLEDLTRGHFPKPDSSGQKTWPSDNKDLLQSCSSCEQAVTNLFKWLEFSLIECGAVFQVFTFLAKFSRYFVAEMAKSKDWFDKALDLIHIVLDNSKADDWTIVLRSRKKVVDPLHYTSYWLQLIRVLTYDGHRHVALREPSTLIRFRHLGNQVVELVDSSRFARTAGEQIGWFKITWQAIMSLLINFGEDGNLKPPEVNIPNLGPGQVPVVLDVETIFSTLCHSRARDQCMNPWCTYKGSALRTQRTKTCDGCLTTRFCSSECIKKAWSAAPLPHKVLCKELKDLRNKFTGIDWKEVAISPKDINPTTINAFRALCKLLEVPTEDLSIVYIHMRQVDLACSPDITDPSTVGPYIKNSSVRLMSGSL